MQDLHELRAYEDDRGNSIVFDGAALPNAKVKISFRGRNNRLIIHPGAKIVSLTVFFDGDGALAELGSTLKPRTGLRFAMRLGHASTVSIGENVGCETSAFICVSEGESVRIGNDCMLATSVELRADDSHAIYDVGSGRRLNHARSIHIGDHVWLGKHVAVMAGGYVGDGAVIGFRSVVTRRVPNNCIAVGSPARVVRRNVAWERPMLSVRKPGEAGLPAGHAKSELGWNMTAPDEMPVAGIVSPAPRRWRFWRRTAQES